MVKQIQSKNLSMLSFEINLICGIKLLKVITFLLALFYHIYMWFNRLLLICMSKSNRKLDLFFYLL